MNFELFDVDDFKRKLDIALYTVAKQVRSRLRIKAKEYNIDHFNEIDFKVVVNSSLNVDVKVITLNQAALYAEWGTKTTEAKPFIKRALYELIDSGELDFMVHQELKLLGVV